MRIEGIYPGDNLDCTDGDGDNDGDDEVDVDDDDDGVFTLARFPEN